MRKEGWSRGQGREKCYDGRLGAKADATLGFTNAWGIGDFPLAFAFTITLEGLCFSLITSGLTTWRHLRKTDPGDPT